MFEDGYAVVIGVGGDLPQSEEDAEAIAQRITLAGEDAYPSEQVHLLTGKNATRQSVLDTFEKVHNQAGTNPRATLFFYFSGHGKQTIYADSPSDYYLMTWSYNVNDLEQTAISERELSRWFKVLGHFKKMCLVFDCCHAGGFARLKSDDGFQLRSYPLPPSLDKELVRGGGRVAIASSRADEVSIAGDKHSVFTESLLQSLSGDRIVADDGFIRVLDVFAYLVRVVPARTGGSQNPILNVADLQDNFAIASAARTQQRFPTAVGSKTGIVGDASPEQIATWKRMLVNHRTNLLLIEQRMSEYPLSVDIPLQYKREKDLKEKEIAELRNKIGQIPQ